MTTLNILLVEDSQRQADRREDMLREIFKQLQQENLEPNRSQTGIGAPVIVKAYCVSEARQKLLSVEPPFDLMLLDLGLPENPGHIEDPEAGLKLLKMVWDRKLVELCVVISNFPDYKMRVYELEADFIEKSASSEELMDRLKSCVKEIIARSGPEAESVRQMQQSVIGRSPAMIRVLRQIARIARTDITILLLGEQGTGKELIAEEIHKLTYRNGEEFLAVNVNAIPFHLFEGEMFGHEKGAFTDAHKMRVGHLEKVDKGTFLLDEIGDLEKSLQVKLLRVFENRNFQRLGGSENIPFQARLLCATNHDLLAAVDEGKFRKDLYSRIAAHVIEIPPLRDRDGDLDLLASHFLDRVRARYPQKKHLALGEDALEIIRQFKFLDGNVRELKQLIENAAHTCNGDRILPLHILPLLKQKQRSNPSTVARSDSTRTDNSATEELAREIPKWLGADWTKKSRKEGLEMLRAAFDHVYLPRKLGQFGWNVSKAADDAGIDRNTFYDRWEKVGLGQLRRHKPEDQI
jgi:DNA-binding NtrC family response regulator